MKYLVLFYLNIQILSAQYYCKFNAEQKDIYKSIIELDLSEASIKLKNCKDYKINLATILLEDYIDFFQLFIFEKESDYIRLIDHKKERLQQIKIAKISEEWSLYLQSEILLHWSLIHLKRNENWKAFTCVNEAFEKLNSCNKYYPQFIYSKKSLGILHTLLSTIPEELDWATKLIGLTGDLEKGKKELSEFIYYASERDDIFQTEAKAAFAFIKSYLDNQSKQASQYWNKEMINKSANPLLSMVSIKLFIRAGENKKAQMEVNKLSFAQKCKLPYLFFLSGILKLQDLNYGCDQDFFKFLELYKGKNYIKEAYQKLAWTALLKGSIPKYQYYMKKCFEDGELITDEDVQAQNEAMKKIIPDRQLLKARLLCDGANYNRAYHLLFIRIGEYYESGLRLECAYRMGRICQLNNKSREALSYFQDALEADQDKKSYMSCSAMLYSAYILEELGEKSEACQYYSKTLDIKPDQYSRSLHQKAKTGQLRLSCIN
ncbi:MAG: hypothetical protein ABIO44_08085 [Saprospiraceae bacterium]